MITGELNKSAKAMIANDYVRRLEEENARLLRKVVAAKGGKSDMDELVGWLQEKVANIHDDDEPIDRGRAAGWGETIGYIAKKFGGGAE